MSTCKVHNVRFYNLEPRSVTCLSYNEEDKKIAVSRSDNSLEIWNVQNAAFIECSLPELTSSIESILWVNSKLFSCGLNGMISEYDLSTLTIRNEQTLTGGAAWCMDVNHDCSRLAVGTEEGYINTFFVKKDCLIYERIFDKQKGRILCIKWDNTGGMIFTGSSDTVRVWNSMSGHAIHRMMTSREKVKKETIVWCLAVTDDNMVISGDSRGVLSIWDPSTGTLLESHKSHSADILSVAISQSRKTIYCAGVDHVIRTFSKIIAKSSGRAQWVRGIERRLHIHEVRALVEADGKLFSAGVDGYLALSSYPPKCLVKYPPLLQPPCVIVSGKTRCVVLRYTNSIEIWRLGSTSTSLTESPRPGTLHSLEEKPIKLLQLKTKASETILSFAVSRSSKLIVYSTNLHLRIFEFDVLEGDATLIRSEEELPFKRVQKMLFSPKSKFFVALNNEDCFVRVTLFEMEKKHFRLLGSFRTEKEGIRSIGTVCFSPDNKYLVLADKEGRIAVYGIREDLKSEKFERWNLPRFECPVTAMAVKKNSLDLVVVYANHEIVEYNIPRRQYTEFSKNLRNSLPLDWTTRPFPITNVIFDPSNENIIIMHDDSSVFVIDKENESYSKNAKTARFDSEDENSRGSNSQFQLSNGFQIVKKYKHLVHLEWLNEKELVAVEVNPLSFTEKLPPTLKQKYFGM